MAHVYDVIVVGCGPVGAFLSALLAKYGVDVLVLERDSQVYHSPRAVAMDDEVARSFGFLSTELVSWVDAHNSRVPVELCIGPPSRERLSLMGPSPPIFVPASGFEDTMFFHQPLLEAELRGEMAARGPRLTLLEGMQVESLAQQEDRVTITATRVKGAAAAPAAASRGAGPVQAFRSRWVVGADGGSSFIRKSAGIAFEGDSFPDQHWLVVDIETQDPNLCVAWPHFNFINNPHPRSGRLRSLVHVPLPGHRNGRRFEFLLHPEEDPGAMTTDASVRGLLGELNVPSDARISVIRKTVYTFHARVARHWSQGRVLLAGDAAHCMPPFRGQGMCAGMRDAVNLAWKLASVVRCGAAPSLLASYQAEREQHLRAVIATAVTMGRLITMHSPRWLWHARNAVVMALYHNPVTQPFFKAPFAPPTSLDSGLFDFHTPWGRRAWEAGGSGGAAAARSTAAAEGVPGTGGIAWGRAAWLARDRRTGRLFPNLRVGRVGVDAASSPPHASRFDAVVTGALGEGSSAGEGGDAGVEEPRGSGAGAGGRSGHYASPHEPVPQWAIVYAPHTLAPASGTHPATYAACHPAAAALLFPPSRSGSSGGPGRKGQQAAAAAGARFLGIQLLPAVGWERTAASLEAQQQRDGAGSRTRAGGGAGAVALVRGVDRAVSDITGQLQLFFYGACADCAILRPDRMVYGMYSAEELPWAVVALQQRLLEGGGGGAAIVSRRPSYWRAHLLANCARGGGGRGAAAMLQSWLLTIALVLVAVVGLLRLLLSWR